MAVQALPGKWVHRERALHRAVLRARQRLRGRRRPRRSLSRLRTPDRNSHGRKLLFQTRRIPAEAARFLCRESGFHPSREQAKRSFVQGGLRNLSITRTTIRWGIPVPGEAPHVFYVWFDALIGYLSAVGGPEFDERGLWPADLHMVGKEIIRFHAVYWPAFLMAADLPRPKQIWAHGWLLFDSEKMSKSRGNVVRPRPIVSVLGIEPLRYYLLREIVFGRAGSFSYDPLVSRYNSDLANGLGNLASRTLTMIGRYFGGEIPKPPRYGVLGNEPGSADFASEALTRITTLYDRFSFSLALEAIWEQVAAIDKYLTVEKPWTLAEQPENREQLAKVLYTAAEGLRIVTALAHPVLPQSAEEIWRQLGAPTPPSRVHT